MLFTRLLPRLIDRAHYLGFGATLGELYRPDETVELYALQGRGSLGSLHPLRLAVDLHLFRHEMDRMIYLTKTEHHRPLGEWWERLDPRCRWGGRFGDGNHYSLEWEGRR